MNTQKVSLVFEMVPSHPTVCNLSLPFKLIILIWGILLIFFCCEQGVNFVLKLSDLLQIPFKSAQVFSGQSRIIT